MGIINRLTKHCIFCGLKHNTEYIEAYGIYGSAISGNWYHKECLLEIVCNSEKHPTEMVDMAIEIIDRIKECKRRAENLKQTAQNRCEYLKSHCA